MSILRRISVSISILVRRIVIQHFAESEDVNLTDFCDSSKFQHRVSRRIGNVLMPPGRDRWVDIVKVHRGEQSSYANKRKDPRKFLSYFIIK